MRWARFQIRTQCVPLSVFLVPMLMMMSLGVMLLLTPPASALPFFFSTGNPDGKIGMGSRPPGPGVLEIEAADDFILKSETIIDRATFTGLLTGVPTGSVDIEFYRVFPKDSDTSRSPQVPTRTNSPSDTALVERSTPGDLIVQRTTLNDNFTAKNSVQANGIHPLPNQTTGGNGPVTGREDRFDVTFTKPVHLPPDHYFFVPQVEVAGGDFFWLSAPKPIVAPGTPFSPDLQAWIRDGNLEPDWLRVGTDIVGGPDPPTFNGTFDLNGEVVPEPGTMLLLGTGLAGLALVRRRRVTP